MLTASMVDELACLLFFSDMQELWRLKNNLPAYLSTAAAWVSSVELDRNDMADYTEKMLLFWRSNAPKFSAWGRLARVFLSMAPSSAAVELRGCVEGRASRVLRASSSSWSRWRLERRRR